MESFLFVLFAVSALVCAGVVVGSRNLLHSVVALFFCLCLIAFMFFMLNAPFVGAAQFMIYAGGIVVLIAFAVMLVRRITGQEVVHLGKHAPSGVLLAAAFFTWSIYLIHDFFSPAAAEGVRIPLADARAIRQAVPVEEFASGFLQSYLVPFEIASVLILVAMVGAVALVLRRPGSGSGSAAEDGGPALRSLGEGGER